MDKRFSIHDWQAKQRRLIEADKKDMSISNADINILDKLVKKHKNASSPLIKIDDLMNKISSEKEYKELVSKYNKLSVDRRVKVLKDRPLEEHHAGDYKPGFLKQSVNTFLDKLKKKTKEGKDYKTVEKIMEKYFSAKKKNEASTTGTGASITPGTGAAYATPKAFGNDKNKKKKGYMGYKEI